MKIKTLFIPLLTRLFLTLLPGMIFVPALHAQFPPPQQQPETRVLLIFDTSAAMKKRLPAEVKGIKQLFALSLAERLQNGDSIGVWTFDRDVHAGECPLQTWQVQSITVTASNVLDFIETRPYSHSTSFKQLTPLVNHVVSISPRLLVIIFCDGDGQFTGTPFDDSVNAAFKAHDKDMRKADEPFVIVLRGEDGHYSGSTINSAESINVPHFPQVAASPQFPPPEAPVPQPPPAPAPQSPPPLIIIGNTVGTNVPPPPPAPSDIIKEPPRTNTAPPAVSPSPESSVQTNAMPVAESLPETNSTPPVAVVETPTNAAVPAVTTPPPAPVAAAPTPPAGSTATAYAVATVTPINKGAVLAVAAGVILIIAVAAIWSMIRRSRRHDSLITESLKKR